MIEKLIKLQENSYSPYSNFKVSAIAVMKDGHEFNGVNVENASYGATICAERSAILSAISSGYKKGDFKELYVMVSSERVGTPCFICRQVISELFDKDAIIHCCSTTGEIKDYTVEELCPYPFGEDDLK
ncbi:MAG: cytidine deaminase [Firmicutes bacterium]|nr:cytidine deaminase [Bacillota bacterium]